MLAGPTHQLHFSSNLPFPGLPVAELSVTRTLSVCVPVVPAAVASVSVEVDVVIVVGVDDVFGAEEVTLAPGEAEPLAALLVYNQRWERKRTDRYGRRCPRG